MLWESRQWKGNAHLRLLIGLDKAVGSDHTLGERKRTHSRSQSHWRAKICMQGFGVWPPSDV